MSNIEVKKYWDNDTTESMYDKNLLEIETEAVLAFLDRSDSVIDIGCGEGEGTVRYFEKVRELLALDYSETRLEKLKSKNSKIDTIRMDMREVSCESTKKKFTKAITQRSLVNLESFDEQKKAIKAIHSLLEDAGRYIMLEGFNDGVTVVNKIRTEFSLPPIGVKWHNVFFNKKELLEFTRPYFELVEERDFSTYFFMTRVFNAILKHPNIPKWDDEVNMLAKKMEIAYKNRFIKGISRLELLVFKKR
ncbi:MAG: class I SAM-dependent methyltransferase [Deltaproteobacteria bacterium]|nr:class I SAM-dependent methyltransferase [Deltaproteobacteria bacterium]